MSLYQGAAIALATTTAPVPVPFPAGSNNMVVAVKLANASGFTLNIFVGGALLDSLSPWMANVYQLPQGRAGQGAQPVPPLTYTTSGSATGGTLTPTWAFPGDQFQGGYPVPIYPSDTTLNASSLQGTPVNPATPTTGQALVFDGSQWSPTSAAGDLGGSYLAPKVVGLQGYPVSSSAPNAGGLLFYNAGSWQSSVSPNAGSWPFWTGAGYAWTPGPLGSGNAGIIYFWNGSTWAIGGYNGAGPGQAGYVLTWNGSGWYAEPPGATTYPAVMYYVANYQITSTSPTAVAIVTGPGEFDVVVTARTNQTCNVSLQVYSVDENGAFNFNLWGINSTSGNWALIAGVACNTGHIACAAQSARATAGNSVQVVATCSVAGALFVTASVVQLGNS